MMAFGLRHNSKNRVIDFDTAFVQSPLPPDKVTYLDIPKGDFSDIFGADTTGKCLRLKRSLYGLSIALDCGVPISVTVFAKLVSSQARMTLVFGIAGMWC